MLRDGRFRGGAASGLGQRVDLALTDLRTLDELFVDEQLEGGVHGSWARCPRSAGASLDRTDELVAVHRLVAELSQNGRANVARFSAVVVVARRGGGGESLPKTVERLPQVEIGEEDARMARCPFGTDDNA
ncbi:hypothetical protein GCM10025867_40610 [Frondihabitans sucicola]|uniref:Uncharacterized protein n=1 Tax=Frondihabitans sucicola TaxID=1268041 RepID=A0ABM8GTM0_9MICO|nr:hypothetical protein GCM10025867_40610 [Frondihabitans sucicola]